MAVQTSPKSLPYYNPTIVLVHGEEGDPTEWYPVASLLERAGSTVSVTSLPLTSSADDVAAVRCAFAAQPTGIVAVGHSYGGAVITSAAAGNPQVAALVYVAAFAPDRGESIDDLIHRFGHGLPAPLDSWQDRPLLGLDRSRLRGSLNESSSKRSSVLEPTQRPLHSSAWFTKTAQPAWREMPSWYLVATQDQIIPVQLQRYMADRLGAVRIVEVETDHLPQLAQSALVASFIQEAAEADQ